MTRHSRLSAWCAFLTIVALLAVSCSRVSWDILIPKSVIASQLQKTFPTVNNKGWMTVQLMQPQLEFLGNENRLRIVANVEVKFLGLLPVPGTATASGTLSYHPETGTFHYSDVKVEKFDLPNLPTGHYDEVTAQIGTLLLSSVNGLEIYRLDPKSTGDKLAELVLRGIKVRNDGIVVTVGL